MSSSETRVEHNLEQHAKDCTETEVLSLTITRTSQPGHPESLTVQAVTHLHGTDEIDQALAVLTDLRSRVALAAMQGIAEQAINGGDVESMGAMLSLLLEQALGEGLGGSDDG